MEVERGLCNFYIFEDGSLLKSEDITKRLIQNITFEMFTSNQCSQHIKNIYIA